ncbi:hypothetical protein GCM10028796_44530 [Ramlibacter monticola]
MVRGVKRGPAERAQRPRECSHSCGIASNLAQLLRVAGSRAARMEGDAVPRTLVDSGFEMGPPPSVAHPQSASTATARGTPNLRARRITDLRSPTAGMTKEYGVPRKGQVDSWA